MPLFGQQAYLPTCVEHTCALRVLEATNDLHRVSLWLGHAHMQTTEMYTRADPSVRLEVLEAVTPPKLRSGRFKATDALIASSEVFKLSPRRIKIKLLLAPGCGLWNDAYFVGAIRIEMDDMNALPVACLAFPAQRIILAGALVERCTTIQDVLVEIAVTLGWRDEADSAVTRFCRDKTILMSRPEMTRTAHITIE